MQTRHLSAQAQALGQLAHAHLRCVLLACLKALHFDALAGEYSPYVDHKPQTKPLWGDTHLHTAVSIDPEDLWRYLADHEKNTQGAVLSIPHNGKLSSGMMFCRRYVA